MKRLLQTTAVTLLLLFVAAAHARADVKIKSKSTAAGQTSEQVTYIKGKRQRAEHNPATVMIMQCDLRRMIDLNQPTKTYVVTSFDASAAATSGAAQGAGEQTGAKTAARRGGVVTTTIKYTDTGERKTIFGYTARHIKTSMMTESSPEACQQNKSRMETDGWYIDAVFALDCADRNVAANYAPPARPDGCRDEYRMKQVGAATKLGYPVMLTTTMYDENNQPGFTWTQEVTEISKTALDDALFDVPADYREVKDRQEMYSAASMRAAAQASGTNQDDSATTGSASMPVGAGAGAGNQRSSGAQLGPKREGVVRVGVVLTRVTSTGDGISPQALGEATRNTLVSYLNGPAVEIVQLEARLPQQAEAEAAQKECDYVLYSTATHKKGGGGGFGGFLKKAAPGLAASAIPYGGGTAGAVAGNVASTAIYTAASVAGSVKAKDELTLEYTLQPASGGADGAPVVSKTIKAKAKSDGEDLISQLSAQAAAEVLSAATRK
ncbi:MAG TPA: hypothetical protein VM934_11940 [Pyrinomonadaceae bacterium]|jgi:hypothetical protein|nr:hypothetical protein [Pyrinomonadaceae bacterium]